MSEHEAPAGSYLVEPGFAVEPAVRTIHNGKPYMIRTCYEWTGGKWEGFVSMKEAA